MQVDLSSGMPAIDCYLIPLSVTGVILLCFFEDGTNIVLARDFSIQDNSAENIDMVNDFINKVHRKLSAPVLELAHDEVEFMDI